MSQVKVVEKIPVIVRRDQENKDLLLFFPTMEANFGRIAFWDGREGHGEAAVSYFWRCKRPGDDQEIPVKAMMDRYQSLYADKRDPFELERKCRDSNAMRQVRWRNTTERFVA